MATAPDIMSLVAEILGQQPGALPRTAESLLPIGALTSQPAYSSALRLAPMPTPSPASEPLAMTGLDPSLENRGQLRPWRLPSVADMFNGPFTPLPPAPLGPPRMAQSAGKEGEAPALLGGPATVTPEPDADAIVRGAEAAASSRPPAAPAGASPARTALRQPGVFDYIDTALAGMAGGAPVLSRVGERFDARNATYDALIQRGATPELAQAITLNPAQFAPILPSLFTPRTSIVNNRLVDTTTGRVIADLSDKFVPLPEGASVLNTGSGQTSGSSLPKPPQGFEWVDQNDRSKGLRAIPGGPGTHISSEVAGRLALMQTARQGVQDARSVYERRWGAVDFARQGAANIPFAGDFAPVSGEQGIAQRNIRIAVESALRTMTGAAAPEPEVVRYAAMFTPGARDTVQSAKQKLDALDNFMRRAEEIVTQGRTATPANAGWSELTPGVRFREVR